LSCNCCFCIFQLISASFLKQLEQILSSIPSKYFHMLLTTYKLSLSFKNFQVLAIFYHLNEFLHV
jgi:hypothetical protein